MEEYRTFKTRNLAKLMIISVIIVVMFFVGFLSGGSLIYGLTSPEIDSLQNQIDSLQNVNNDIELQNVTYFYNDTALSNLYEEVKDSIVVISGEVAYQTFFRNSVFRGWRFRFYL